METVQRARPNPFYALAKYRGFRLLWSAAVIMQISEWVQNITLGWLALTLTNSAAFVGQVTFMAGLPILLLTLPAGALLDRLDRRRVLIVVQFCGTLLALTVAYFVGANHIEPWHLLVVAVLNGSLLAISVPAVQAQVPQQVERADLTNALGLSTAGTSSTRMLGPSLGGLIIGALGVVWCFVIQGVGLLLSAIFTLRIGDERVQQPAAERQSRGSVLAALRQDPVLIGLLLQAAAPGLLAYPVLSLLPVLARDHLGLDAVGLGVLMAASGVGATVGSLIVASLGAYPHKGRLLMIIGVCYGFVMTAFAQSPWVVLSCVLLACSSVFGVLHNALTATLLQSRVPEAMRGQLTAALALCFGLTPIGAFAFGALAENIGISNAISCGALATSLWIGVTLLAFRSVREL